jgi:hypothetical protein
MRCRRTWSSLTLGIRPPSAKTLGRRRTCQGLRLSDRLCIELSWSAHSSSGLRRAADGRSPRGIRGACVDAEQALGIASSYVTQRPRFAGQVFIDSPGIHESPDAWIVSFRFRREQRPAEGMILVRKTDCLIDGMHGRRRQPNKPLQQRTPLASVRRRADAARPSLRPPLLAAVIRSNATLAFAAER